jgi:hypothetical protein
LDLKALIQSIALIEAMAVKKAGSFDEDSREVRFFCRLPDVYFILPPTSLKYVQGGLVS